MHILGVGPVGTLLAHHLRRSLARSRPVTLVHKSVLQVRNAAALGGKISVENQGIVQSSNGYQTEVFDEGDQSGAGIYLDSTLPSLVRPNTDHIETLFVTVKAQNTASAISRMVPRLSSKSTVVLLQNGMGIYEELVQRLFRNPESRPHFILATNTHGAWLKSPLHVVHAGAGSIEFGIVPDGRGRDFEVSLSDESKPLPERGLSLDDLAREGDTQYSSLRDTVAVLSSLDGLSCSWRPISDIQLAMRKKVVVNAVINPLTAIFGCRNGELFKDEASNRILYDVCSEAAAAFQAQLEAETGTVLGSDASCADKSQTPLGRIPHDLRASMLVQEVKRVANLTRGNISSTLADVRKGRPTEILFLNGYLARLGKQYGIPMPVNTTLVTMVNIRSAIPVDQIL